jgi:hypothetical protein
MKNCCQSFSAQTKANMINFINKFAKKNEQDIYLQGLIESKPVQNITNRNAPEELNKHEADTYSYYVNTDVEKKEICKKAFISLHGLTLKRVYRL